MPLSRELSVDVRKSETGALLHPVLPAAGGLTLASHWRTQHSLALNDTLRFYGFFAYTTTHRSWRLVWHCRSPIFRRGHWTCSFSKQSPLALSTVTPLPSGWSRYRAAS